MPQTVRKHYSFAVDFWVYLYSDRTAHYDSILLS